MDPFARIIGVEWDCVGENMSCVIKEKVDVVLDMGR
jgi:hypothetical protein